MYMDQGNLDSLYTSLLCNSESMVLRVLSDLPKPACGQATKNNTQQGQGPSELFLVMGPQVSIDKLNNTLQNHALFVLLYTCTSMHTQFEYMRDSHTLFHCGQIDPATVSVSTLV